MEERNYSVNRKFSLFHIIFSELCVNEITNSNFFSVARKTHLVLNEHIKENSYECYFVVLGDGFLLEKEEWKLFTQLFLGTFL